MRKIIYIFLLKNTKENQKKEEIFEQLVENTENNTEDNNENYEELFKQNKDMVAWIKIENTNIDYPVMQYYRNKTFKL